MSASQLSNETDPVDQMHRQGMRIQQILARIEAMPERSTREILQECMESVLKLYGDGLERILSLVKDHGGDGQMLLEDLVHDNLISGLLLIHGLHPHDITRRLEQALDKVRPYMESHGGNVELLSLEHDFARLRLQGSCHNCPSSSLTLELAVRRAIEEACPDLVGFEVEGAVEVHRPNNVHSEWLEIHEARQIFEGSFMACKVAGNPLLVCRVSERLYGYQDRCPACNTPLHLGSLQSGLITCAEGHCFSATDAGRSPDNPGLHLDPIPLIDEHDIVKVAIRPCSLDS